MPFEFETIQIYHNDCLRITGASKKRSVLHFPAANGALNVLEIAPHAFESDATLQEAVLTEGLQSVGRFAFLNCTNLKTLELTDSVQSFADTALRQCDSLALIRVHIHHNDPRVLSQLLAAVEKEITLELICPDGKAVLLFPDYNYVYTEHTMSRAFLFNIDGCGMAYRECVDFNGVGFREYDKLFEKERQEDPHTAPFLALNRLMYPYRLSPMAKEMYESFFKNDLYLTGNPLNGSTASKTSSLFEISTSAGIRKETDDITRTLMPAQIGEEGTRAYSYAAGDGVFLLSAENRDERPDFLKKLILQNDISRLTFLTKEKLLSVQAAGVMLKYTDSDTNNCLSSPNNISNTTGKITHIRALLMDYLRISNPKTVGSERLTL